MSNSIEVHVLPGIEGTRLDVEQDKRPRVGKSIISLLLRFRDDTDPAAWGPRDLSTFPDSLHRIICVALDGMDPICLKDIPIPGFANRFHMTEITRHLTISKSKLGLLCLWILLSILCKLSYRLNKVPIQI